MAQRQARKYLEAQADYGFDQANISTIEAQNFGTNQDILSLRMGDILGSLSTEKRLEAEQAEKRKAEENMSYMLIAGIFAVVIVLLIY